MGVARVLASVAVIVAVAGCVIFTGDTGGYEGPDAGCQGAQDCAVDAGQVCCVSGLAAASNVVAVCTRGPCAGPIPVQLCSTNGECAGGLCLPQQCSLGDGSPVIPIRACGGVSLCAAQ
jgi:hypothetical protein